MKIFLPFSLWLALSAPVSWAADGPPVESKISTGVGSVQSVFNLPTNSKEGRDPFFPESTRALVAAASTNHTVEITALKVRGISGAAEPQAVNCAGGAPKAPVHAKPRTSTAATQQPTVTPSVLRMAVIEDLRSRMNLWRPNGE